MSQRPRRARLGGRRHRGRGRDARPAHVHADPAGGRVPPDRRAAERRDGHRPGAHHHRACCASTAWSASSSSSTARAWPRCRWPTAPRSATCHRSSAPPARSSRSTPNTLDYLQLTGRPREAARPRRGVRQGAGPLARPRPASAVLRGARASTCPPSSRRSRARSARRTGSRSPTPRRPSATPCRTTCPRPAWTTASPAPSRPRTRWRQATGPGRRTRSTSPWKTARRRASTTVRW